MIKPLQPGFRPWENHTTVLRARKCIPLWWLAPPPCPLFEGAQQPVLTVEMLMKRVFRGVLFCPLNRGGKGTRFVREQSDLRIV